MIIKRLIIVNYKSDIDINLPFKEQIINLAFLYRERLISLVVNWIRVGYCQNKLS